MSKRNERKRRHNEKELNIIENEDSSESSDDNGDTELQSHRGNRGSQPKRMRNTSAAEGAIDQTGEDAANEDEVASDSDSGANEVDLIDRLVKSDYIINDATLKRINFEKLLEDNIITLGDFAKKGGNRGRTSDVWTFFKEMSIRSKGNGPAEKVKNLGYCRVCGRAVKMGAGIGISRPMRHMCYIQHELRNQIHDAQCSNSDESELKNVKDKYAEPAHMGTRSSTLTIPERKMLKRAEVAFIVEDNHPMHSLGGFGLAQIAAFFMRLGARTGARKMTPTQCQRILYGRNTIATEIMNSTKNVVGAITPELIEAVLNHGIAITVDGWQDSHLHRHYQAVTAHYALKYNETDEDGTVRVKMRMVERCLGLELMPEHEPRNGENILKTVRRVFEKYTLLIELFDQFPNRFLLIYDRASSNLKGFRLLEGWHCLDHIYNSTAGKMIDVPDIKTTFDKVHTLINMFKRRGLNNALTDTLKLSCATRWNSTYTMFDSLCKSWNEVLTIVNEPDYNDLKEMIENIDVDVVKAAAKVLKVFVRCTKMTEASSRPTLHLVLVYYWYICSKLETHDDEDTNITSEMKKVGLQYFRQAMMLTNYHFAATCLHPGRRLACTVIEDFDLMKKTVRILIFPTSFFLNSFAWYKVDRNSKLATYA